MAKEVKQWITVNGVHVPIFEGESKADAVKRAVKKTQGTKKTGESFTRKESNVDNAKRRVEELEAELKKHKNDEHTSYIKNKLKTAKEDYKKLSKGDTSDSNFKTKKEQDSVESKADKVLKEGQERSAKYNKDMKDLRESLKNAKTQKEKDRIEKEIKKVQNKYADDTGKERPWKDEETKTKQIKENKRQADERNDKTSSKMTKKQRIEAAKKEIAHLSDEEFKGSAGSASALAKKYNLSSAEAGQIVYDRATGRSTKENDSYKETGISNLTGEKVRWKKGEKEEEYRNKKKQPVAVKRRRVDIGDDNSGRKIKKILGDDKKMAEWKISKAYDRSSLRELALEVGMSSSLINAMPTDDLRAKLLAMYNNKR